MTKRGTTDSQASARNRILDAAESAFARDGFAGAGMKGIAISADVAQGLIHYHFDNKEGLYAAVIERRSAMINAEREAMLSAIDLNSPQATRQILRALLAPPFGPNGGGRAYARILAGLAAGEQRDVALVAEHYDSTAERFIAALGQACPGASRQAIRWAYNLSITAMIAISAHIEDPARLPLLDDDTDEGFEALVRYAEGGLRALIDPQ